MIALEKLLSLLPPCLLEQLALEHHVDARNQVRLRGSTVFICLLNGLLNHGDLTQRLLEEIYQQHYQPQTAHRADHSSFGKRLASIKPAFFAAIYAHLHQRMAPQATAGETKALRLRWADATSVLLSAKLLSFGLLSGTRRQQGQYRAVKSVLALHEDGLPHLLHVCRDPSETGDSVALGRTMHQHSQPGDLWIFDKGVHGRQRLLDIAEAGAFFLTPHGCQGVRVGRVLWRSEEPEPSALPAEGQPAFVPLRAEQVVFETGRLREQPGRCGAAPEMGQTASGPGARLALRCAGGPVEAFDADDELAAVYGGLAGGPLHLGATRRAIPPPLGHGDAVQVSETAPEL